MTDKEMAEKTVMDHAKEAIQEQIAYFKFAEQMFLAGLKAGRPQWHYVKDRDLPNTEFGRADVTVAYINAYENPCKRDCCFDGTNFIYWDARKPVGWKKADIFGKIYAWKYPEKLPEPPKENE